LVIALDPISVVNHLSFVKVPPNMRFHNQPMLSYVSCLRRMRVGRLCKEPIAATHHDTTAIFYRFAFKVITSGTGSRAKVVPISHLGWWAGKRLSASLAELRYTWGILARHRALLSLDHTSSATLAEDVYIGSLYHGF
jgi:hypothetical protein